MSAGAPQLRADLAIIEQVFRNEQSFVVKDPTTHAYFRFRPMEIRVMRLFDGLRSAADVADALVAEGMRISAGTVDGFARKLSKLGLLERSLMERTTQQLERLRSERRRQRSLFRGELFRMRFSFGDPDRLLTRTYPLIRWCFTPTFVVLSITAFAAYLAIMGLQAREYAADLGATFGFAALTPWSIVVLFGAFTLLTAIHELGHAFACKHFGGEVHEMGFMLLFFMPAFYANVNDAWSFPQRSARLWVTVAGPWIELFVTALLAIAWLVVQPGSVISEIALAAMLIGGVANLLTNFNPLLPLDGYFALGDWLEITNLRQRARAYAGAWIRRTVLREDVPMPDVDAREQRILLAYGITATVYVTGFLLLLASRLVGYVNRTLGALLAGMLVLLVLYALRRILVPALRALRHGVRRGVASAWGALRAGGRRGTRWRLGAGIAILLVLASAVVPVGLTAHGTFTVAPVMMQTVTAPASGVIADVFVREGDAVVAGAPVLRLVDYRVARDELRHRRAADSLAADAHTALVGARLGESDVLAVQMAGATANADESRARLDAMRIRASVGGEVLTLHPERLKGRRVAFGDTLLRLADLTGVEAIIRLSGAGAVGVRPGNPVKLMSYRNAARPLRGVVDAVSPVADATGRLVGTVEARVRLDADVASLAGATGEARVTWRQATLLSAVVWSLRARLRSDLLL